LTDVKTPRLPAIHAAVATAPQQSMPTTEDIERLMRQHVEVASVEAVIQPRAPSLQTTNRHGAAPETTESPPGPREAAALEGGPFAGLHAMSN
jgi:hypothetical protein